MNISQAEPQEWSKVRDLYISLLKSDPEAFADEYDEIVLRPDEQWIEDLNKTDGATFVAEENGKFVAMGRINFYKEIPGIPVLHKLGVLPVYRGQGIAKQLVTAREKWAKEQGADKIRLYVVADRNRTIEFSIKNGYKQKELLRDGIKKNDGSTVDMIIMEKEL